MINMPTPQPEADDHIHTLLAAAFAEAEEYYLAHWVPHGIRIDHDDDWDEDTFNVYARLWLTMLYTWDFMHGALFDFDKPGVNTLGDYNTYTRLLKGLDEHDFDDYLTAMYG